jgi:hypothetical protein
VRPYFLPAHVYACAVQNQVIFLDLRRNRYLSATLQELQRVAGFVDGWPSELQAEGLGLAVDVLSEGVQTTLTNLVKHQLLYPSMERTHDRGTIAKSAGPPARAAISDRCEKGTKPVTLGHLLSFVRAATLARYRLAACSFYSTIRRIGKRRMRHSVYPESSEFAELGSLVAAFRRLRPLLPASKVPCLLSSLVLIEFLARYGHFPNLVFGVRAAPFSAHCWVQHGCMVLNCTLEEALTFTPIMVV